MVDVCAVDIDMIFMQLQNIIIQRNNCSGGGGGGGQQQQHNLSFKHFIL